jgi:hypothetical protein
MEKTSSILDYFKNNCNFIKFDISDNLKSEESKWGLFGSNQARLYRDTITDTFVQTIFSDSIKLNLFVDYCFYEIYSNSKSRINKMLHEHKLPCLDGNESINVIFKGGNVMSFFYNDTLSYFTTEKKLDVKLGDVINFFIEQQLVSEKYHNILNDLITESNMQNINEIGTINDYLEEQKKNFKISDVDFSFTIVCGNPIKFKLISQLCGIIIIESLVNIKKFFNSYYLNVTSEDQQEIKDIEEVEMFDSYDSPVNNILDIYEIEINKLRDIINKDTILNQDILSFYFSNTYHLLFVMFYAHPKSNSYFDTTDEEYNNVRNLRLVISIYEYLTLIEIYNNKFKFFTSEENKILLRLIYGCEAIKRYHLLNKKKKLLVNNFYTLEEINTLLENISKKYNSDTTPALYNTLYENIKIFKDNIFKYELKAPLSTNLKFNKYKKGLYATNNDIDIKGRNNFMIKYINDYSVIETLNFEEGNDNYHFITFNNVLYMKNDVSPTIAFDLYRIKFNFVLNNLVKINDKLKSYNVPSEFIDVSMPNYDDSSLHHFIENYNKNGLYIYERIQDNHQFFWNAYSLQQLFEDIFKVLLKSITILPWYDIKYAKRINRALLLFLLIKFNDMILNNNANLKWLKSLISMLNLLFKIKKNINDNKENLEEYKNNYPYLDVSKFIVEKSNKDTPEKNIIITEYMLNLSYINIKNGPFALSLHINKRFEDFTDLLRLIIFYSYYMYNDNFLEIINLLREKSGMLKYTKKESVLKNNQDYIKLLDVTIKTLFVIIYISIQYLSIIKNKNK